MILDLVGVPGAGKTYFVTQFSKYLSSNNIKYFDILNSRRNKLGYKIYFFIYRKLVIFNKKYIKLRRDLFEIIRLDQNGLNNKNISDDINDLCFNFILYNKYSKKRKLYLFDESLYHQLLSISIFYNFSIETFEKLYVKIFDNHKFNNCTILLNCCNDNAVQSIHKRNRHVCTLDEYSDIEIMKYYNKFNLYLNSKKYKINFIINRVNGDYDISNFDEIIEFINANK